MDRFPTGCSREPCRSISFVLGGFADESRNTFLLSVEPGPMEIRRKASVLVGPVMSISRGLRFPGYALSFDISMSTGLDERTRKRTDPPKKKVLRFLAETR